MADKGMPHQAGSDEFKLRVRKDEDGFYVPISMLSSGFAEDGAPVPVGAANPLPTTTPQNLDAFGRLRVSNPTTLFDSKQLYDENPLFWDTALTGTGAIAHSIVNAATTLSVTGAGSVIRQTFMRFNYQPGKGQLIFLTGVFGAGVAGVVKRMGYFDGTDGLFFEQDGATLRVGKLKAGSATLVDQASWNLDVMDGSGSSGLTLDPTKTLIFVIDFEWLGVGRVRMGVVIGGAVIYVHEFLHSNIETSVYMSTPNLPCRYEIVSAGGTSDLVHICSSVISEGGVEEHGLLRYESLGADTVNANAIGTIYAVMGLRLKSAHIGATVNLIDMSIMATTNSSFEWLLLINPTVAGTFNYADLANSSMQVAKADIVSNPSTNTVTGGTLLGGGHVTQQTRSAQKQQVNARRLGAAIDGTRDTVVLAVRPLTGNLDITGGITWREVQ
jgi:hypothetical protein